MALLDVSDLLTDPDFCDTLSVVRRSETVTDKGRAAFASETIPIVGVVQAPSADTLNLLPDEANRTGAIQVHTTFPLRGVTAQTAADWVLWNALTYTVHDVADFTNYGAGFVSAICLLNNLSGVTAPAP